jgi:carbonic anhydrase
MEKIKINPMGAPAEIFQQMLENNKIYQQSPTNGGDISAAVRTDTAENGQRPYAAIVACADSRVVPEHIFMAGIGELFTVRSAGNTIGAEARGSIEYAVGHLGVRLIIVMGHTHCGAVGAAMKQAAEHEAGDLKNLISQIEQVVAGAPDELTAIEQNVQNSVNQLLESPILAQKHSASEIEIRSVVYNIETGEINQIA